jgi:hypothetical protein
VLELLVHPQQVPGLTDAAAIAAKVEGWGYPDSVDSSQGLTDLSVRVLMNCCS